MTIWWVRQAPEEERFLKISDSMKLSYTPHMNLHLHSLLIVLLTAGALCLVSCDDSNVSGESGAFSMNASGGKVGLSDGAEVSVPAGALQSTVSIGIANLGESAYPATTFTPVGDFYRLTPVGQKFNQPVKIVLPYNPGLVGAQGADVRIFLSSNEGITFESLPLLSSPKSSSVGGQTLHFSIAVAGLPVGGTAQGPSDGQPIQNPAESGGGQSPTHDGCSPATEAGCGGCACESAVCQVSPPCCTETWASSCAQLCAQLGGDCGGNTPEDTEDTVQPDEDTQGTESDATAPQSDSCVGHCGGQAPAGCFCDAACISKGDCCADSCEVCEFCETGCGNSECESGETCQSCPTDCGACADVCGDGACGATETCDSCALDCCNAYCGDDACNGGENCTNCPGDCGECEEEVEGSCLGKCDQSGIIDGCFCDPMCLSFGDCCPDACVICNVCP